MMNQSRLAISYFLFLLASQELVQAQSNPKESIEAQVRQALNLEMETQELRIKKLEAELALVKSKLANRRANLNSIVASRVAALTQPSDSSQSADSANAKAAEIAARAWALWRTSKYSEALSLFEQAVVLEPNDANHWNGLGWSRFNLGQFETALSAFEKSVMLTPDHPAALNGIGQSYLALGKLDLAEKALLAQTEGIIKTHGEESATNAACWYGLIRVYIAKKEKEKAVQWAEKLLKYKPNEEVVKSFLSEAKKL